MINKMEGEPSAYTNHHAGYSPAYTCNAHDNSANYNDERYQNNQTIRNTECVGNGKWYSDYLFPNGKHSCTWGVDY